jgi:hypothetical protein
MQGVSCWTRRGVFPHFTPAIVPLTIDRQAPCHPDEPCAEPLAIAKLAEAAIRLDERFLRDILGVLPVPQHPVSDPERERGRLDEPGLEFPLERLIHGYEATSQPDSLVMHRVFASPEHVQKQPPRTLSTQSIFVLGDRCGCFL